MMAVKGAGGRVAVSDEDRSELSGSCARLL